MYTPITTPIKHHNLFLFHILHKSAHIIPFLLESATD